jgi:hypothetical protein
VKRFANGSQSTGEHRSNPEYDAGYRDGYRAADERSKQRLAYLEAHVQRMSEEYANLAALQPPAAVVLSAEDAKQFIGR